ncbi:hypothetical protein D4764_20G0008600 [Takifugu flavidus]|uniref:Uncharacterized protein n=1 Tax=Takifugu flavidus TaxID=433684 RepID=A0A5C6NJA9_9TELE|nr:hypothetical protein D4764_20G0008600 [Takifugu flavidus]
MGLTGGLGVVVDGMGVLLGRAFTDRLSEPVTSQQAQDPIAPHTPTYPPPTRPTNPLWAGSSNGHNAAEVKRVATETPLALLGKHAS